MGGIIGGIASGIGAEIGGYGGYKEAKNVAKQGDKFEKERLEKMLGFITAEGGAAKANLRESIGGFRKTGQDSRANLAKIADNRVRMLKEQEGQNVQAAQTAAFRQGGAASNKRGLASRGVRSDTTRAMLQLDELFNNSFNALGAQEAGAVGGARQGLAQAGLEMMRQKVAAQGSQQNFISPNSKAATLQRKGGGLSAFGSGMSSGKGKGGGGGMGGGAGNYNQGDYNQSGGFGGSAGGVSF